MRLTKKKEIINIHTQRSIEHKKEPTAASRPDTIGDRARYSHINTVAGVMTT